MYTGALPPPGPEIAPEYLPYTVATRDGRVHAGLVRAEGAVRHPGHRHEREGHDSPGEEIDQIRPSGTSIMPVGLAGGLGEAGVRDLIAFLASTR